MESTQPRTLPDELIDRIIAMLPFPFIVQARALSKSWRARFSALSTLIDEDEDEDEDEAVQRDAATFQRQVRERARNWSSFFPVCMADAFLCGYETESQTWVRFPSLSFLPEAFRSPSTYHWIEGPLLYGLDRENDTLYMVNVLTRDWRFSTGLPPVAPPAAGYNPISARGSSSDGYKVIYLQGDDDFLHKWCVHIYEPKSAVWDSQKLFQGGEPLVSRPVCLNGVLYMASYNRLDCLLAYNLEEEFLVDLELTFDGVVGKVVNVFLVGCNGRLYFVVTESNSPKPLRVLAVDLESGRLSDVARAPAAFTKGSGPRIDKTVEPVGVGRYIFFPTATLHPSPSGRKLHHPGIMVACDVEKNEWKFVDFASKMGPAFKCDPNSNSKSCRNLKWIPSSFEPGSNPFADVYPEDT